MRMTWLARQPRARVLTVAAAWLVGLPAAVYLGAHAALWWTLWRAGGGFGSVQFDLAGPGGAIALGLVVVPPVALLTAWRIARRRS